MGAHGVTPTGTTRDDEEFGALLRRYRRVANLTQEDLASLAGTSRLTVSRVLRDMRARGQVEVSRGRLVVRGPGKA